MSELTCPGSTEAMAASTKFLWASEPQLDRVAERCDSRCSATPRSTSMRAGLQDELTRLALFGPQHMIVAQDVLVIGRVWTIDPSVPLKQPLNVPFSLEDRLRYFPPEMPSGIGRIKGRLLRWRYSRTP